MREATTVPQRGRRWKWTGAEQPAAAVRRVQVGSNLVIKGNSERRMSNYTVF